MQPSLEKHGPKFGPEIPRSFAGDTATITVHQVTEAVSSVLGRAFGSDAKRVATAANSNVETARNWIECRNAPSLTHFLRLAAVTPELKALVRSWLDLDAANDPETERLLTQLINTIQRRRDPP